MYSAFSQSFSGNGFGQTAADTFALYTDAGGTTWVMDQTTGNYVGQLPAGTDPTTVTLQQDGQGNWYVQNLATGAIITTSGTSPTSPTAAVSSTTPSTSSLLGGLSSSTLLLIGAGAIALMMVMKKKKGKGRK